MQLREILHVIRQCHTRQHFVDRHELHGHPGRHEKTYDEQNQNRIIDLLRNRTCVQMKGQKMR